MDRQKRKRVICILSTFMLSVVTKMIFVLQPVTIKMVSDNFGCLLGSAYLAGLDWRQAAPSNYYGQGWYIIYSFLFRLTSDAYLIYKIIIVTNIVLICCVSILIYLILVKFIGFKDGCFPVTAAVICVHFMTDPGNGIRISNETPVFIFSWLICFSLLYTYFYKDNKKKCIVGIIMLEFFQAYGLLIHTRMVAITISIVLCMLLFYVSYKEWIINPIIYLLSTIGTTGVALAIKKYIVGILWRSENVGEIHNYNLGVERAFKVKYSIKAIADTFFSNIYKLIISTDGILCIGIVLLVVLIIKVIMQLIRKEQLIQNTKRDKILFIMFVTFIFCVAICICGVVMLYADGIEKGYAAGKENDRFSGLTYTRYYFSFAGPMLLATLSIANLKSDVFCKYYKWVFLIWIPLFIYIYSSVVPELDKYLPRLVKRQYVDDTTTNILMTFYIVVILMMLWFLLVKYNKSILFIGIMIIQVFYNGIPTIKKPYLEVYSSIAGASYSLISAVEKDFILPREIYTYKIRKDETQLLLNQYTIIPLEDLQNLVDKGEILILTGNVSDEDRKHLSIAGYNGLALDNNEWVWTADMELYEIIVEYTSQREQSKEEEK